MLDPQQQLSAEIAEIRADYAGAESGVRRNYPPYRSSALRYPRRSLQQVDPEEIELHSPAFGHIDVDSLESDLTIQHSGAPVGERMKVRGRVLDGQARPVRGQLIEVWQANAAGRYIHQRDQHPAPIDPNFTGTGRCLTGADGSYEFTTIKPGPYPWKNHQNAWRPAHIHFSLFGNQFIERSVTQMYFPGDPLFNFDPILQSVVDPSARGLLIAKYDHAVTEPEWCTGYTWDIVLTGSDRTPMEDHNG